MLHGKGAASRQQQLLAEHFIERNSGTQLAARDYQRLRLHSAATNPHAPHDSARMQALAHSDYTRDAIGHGLSWLSVMTRQASRLWLGSNLVLLYVISLYPLDI